MPTSPQLKREDYWTIGAVLAIGLLMTASLAGLGRVWWCERGDLRPWSWNVWSPHNSQHLVDPYALSHLQHGIGLFLLLTWLAAGFTSARLRAVTVAMVEAAWEVTENTSWLIERYREATVSLDYHGDSILNSVGDYGACLIGIYLAHRVPAWLAVVLFCSLELISLLWIRDSLLLNILMLAWPLEAVKQWQLGLST